MSIRWLCTASHFAPQTSQTDVRRHTVTPQRTSDCKNFINSEICVSSVLMVIYDSIDTIYPSLLPLGWAVRKGDTRVRVRGFTGEIRLDSQCPCNCCIAQFVQQQRCWFVRGLRFGSTAGETLVGVCCVDRLIAVMVRMHVKVTG